MPSRETCYCLVAPSALVSELSHHIGKYLQGMILKDNGAPDRIPDLSSRKSNTHIYTRIDQSATSMATRTSVY